MKNAVFAIVQDEPVFLPVWLKHYSKFFEPQNIHIINHESSPENFEHIQRLQKEYGFVLQNVYNKISFDHKWLCKVVATYQHWLLNSYDWVLFCEADEIVTPKDGDLKAYIDNMERSCITTTGWEIVQKEEDPAWNPAEPIINKQRTFWTKFDQFNKPLLSRRPLEWTTGFHGAIENLNGHYFDLNIPRDDNLLLIHLHRIDFDYAFEKARLNSGKNWPEDEDQGHQNKISEERQMKSWFYRDSQFWERIPEEYSGLI